MKKNSFTNNSLVIPQKQPERRYGFLSLFSMVVGLVIGAGIFFKNQTSYQSTESTLLVMCGWILMIVVCLFMLIGYIEISSMSKYSKQQGTLGNWAHNFIGPKIGKLISYFFCFVYIPIALVSFSTYGAGQIVYSIPYMSMEYATQLAKNPWNTLTFVMLFTAIFVGIFIFINTISSKTGKIFQIGGVMIKLIPILVIIFSVSIMGTIGATGGVSNIPPENFGNVWDPTSSYNKGLQNSSGGEVLRLFLFVLPGIMFAFDGFIFAASIQTEAKKQNTYKWALILGMITICVLYFLFSYFTFSVVNPDDPNFNGYSAMSITAVLFPNQAYWLPATFSVFIVVSIFNALSGSTIAYSRMYSGLSEQNYIVDKHGKLLLRNRSMVPHNSMRLMSIITIIWYLIILLFTMVQFHYFMPIYTRGTIDEGLGSLYSNFIPFTAVNFTVNVEEIFAFLAYGIILIGVVINRIKNKVKVDKIRFAPTLSLLSSSIIFLITLIFVFQVFNPVPPSSFNNIEYFWTLLYSTNLALFLLMILSFIVPYLYFNKKLVFIPQAIVDLKKQLVEKFINMEAWFTLNDLTLQKSNIIKVWK